MYILFQVETVEQLVEQMLREAEANNCPIKSSFNGAQLYAAPGQAREFILKNYYYQVAEKQKDNKK